MTHQLTKAEKKIQQAAQQQTTGGKFSSKSRINKDFNNTKLQLVENPGDGDCGWYTLYHQLATYHPAILVEIAETIELDYRQMNWHIIKAIVVGCLQDSKNPQLDEFGHFFGLNLSVMQNARYARRREKVNYAHPGEYLANSIFPLIAMLFNIGIVALYPEVMPDQNHYISMDHYIANDSNGTVYLCHVNHKGHYVSFTGDQTALQQDLERFYKNEQASLEVFYKHKLQGGTTSTNVLPYPGYTPTSCKSSEPMNDDDRKNAWKNGLAFFRKSYPNNVHGKAVAAAFKPTHHAPATNQGAAAKCSLSRSASLYNQRIEAGGGVTKTANNSGRAQPRLVAPIAKTPAKKVDAGCTGCFVM